jgi:hypothetical protein
MWLGSITKTGSILARRLLVESAWHYADVITHADLTNQPPYQSESSSRMTRGGVPAAMTPAGSERLTSEPMPTTVSRPS